MNDLCSHCNGKISIRNPKGFCDHLYYPDNCDVCKDYGSINNKKKDEKEVIFICEECNKIFNEDEKQASDEEKQWGHPCKMHPRSQKPWRCESYLKKFMEQA